MHKKIILIFISIFITLSIIPTAPTFAEQKDNKYFFYKTNDNDNTCEIIWYKENAPNDVVIPSQIDGYTVVEIDGFDGTGNITSVEIPDTVKRIGNGAFSRNKLKEVVIPSSVTYIGDYAFSSNQLESITYCIETTDLGVEVFNDNKITSINSEPSKGLILSADGTEILGYGGESRVIDFIPDSVTRIGKNAFRGTYEDKIKFDSIILGENITHIDELAFWGIGLKEINIPDSVIYIGRGAFNDNEFTSITLPNNEYDWIDTNGTIYKSGQVIEELWRYSYTCMEPVVMTMNDCRITDNHNGTCSIDRYLGTASNLIIPEYLDNLLVTKISYNAFFDCGLSAITIPKSVQAIEYAAFNNNMISSINSQPSDGIIYARNKDGSDDKTRIVSYGGSSKIIDFIPEGVVTIDFSAFNDCSIEDVVFPESILHINDFSFYDNELSSITLPSNLMTIGSSAFSRNSSIDSVIIPDSVYFVGDYFLYYKSSASLPNTNAEWYELNDSGEFEIYIETTYDNSKAYAANVDYTNYTVEQLYDIVDNGDGTCSIINIYMYNYNVELPEQINSLTVTELKESRNRYEKYINSLISNNILQAIDHITYFHFSDTLPDYYEDWSYTSSRLYATNNPVDINPYDCFITDYGNGTCSLDQYVGIYPNIIIPETINNLQVVDIEINIEDNKDLDSIILPNASYDWVDTSGTIYEKNSAILFKENNSINLAATCQRLLGEEYFEILDNNDGTCIIQKYTGYYPDIIIPNTISDLKVIGIGADSFNECNLSNVVLPEATEIIERNAFANNALTEIELPQGLIKIEDSAFENNIINNLSLPSSLKTIGNTAFANNLIQNLTFHEGIISIGEKCFYNNQITNINMPQSISFIGNLAFNKNVIDNINGQQSNALIYSRNEDGTEDTSRIISYGGCLSTIDFIPKNVTRINAYVFSDCNLLEIILPSNIRGWTDENGNIYIQDVNVSNPEIEYSVGVNIPWHEYMKWLYEKKYMLYIGLLLTAIIFMIVSISIIVRKKKYLNEKITKKTMQRKNLITIIISSVLLIIIASGYILFSLSQKEPDSLNLQKSVSPAPEEITPTESIPSDVPIDLSLYSDFIILEIYDDSEITDLSYISNLTNIEELNISSENITGDLSDLSSLINLKSLIIYDFEDSITGNLSSLSSLESLETVLIYSENITGNLSSINSLENLKTLFINSENITGDLSDLASLINLIGITMWSENIEGDLSSLSTLVNLEEFDVSSSSIVGNLSDISTLTKLENLDISSVSITGDLSDISTLTMLENLDISSDSIIGDLSNLSSFINLKHLAVFTDNVTGDLSDLSVHTKLEELFISSNNITGDLYSLNSLANLEKLQIYSRSNKITGDLAELAMFENLKTLTASSEGIIGDLSELSLLTNLEELRFYSNNITGDLDSISSLINLQELGFGSESITGDIDSLSTLINLRILAIRSESITGDISSLSSLTNLRMLTIGDSNSLTGDLSELNTLSNLHYLSIYGCKNLTGSITLIDGEEVTANN